MSELMEVYMRAIGKPNLANSEDKKDWVNSNKTVLVNDPSPHRNWGSMPQLNGFNLPNTHQSRWREDDPEIRNVRISIGNQIGQIIRRMTNKSIQFNQVKVREKFRSICISVESKLFKEASSKAEYVDGATLVNRVRAALVRSKNSGACSNQVIQGEKRKRSMEIINNQAPLQNYWLQQQNYLLDQQQQFPVQKVVVSPDNNMSGLLVDDRLEGLVRMPPTNSDEFVNPQFQNYQHNIQSPVLSKFNCNVGDAVSCRNYVDGLAKSSMNGIELFWCQQQELELNRIVHSNFEMRQVTGQHNAWKANNTPAMPREATCQTTKVDGGISPALELSFKRQKIDNLPMPIDITDHASGEMHPRRVDTFSGYGVPQEWKSIPVHDSPQRSSHEHPQWTYEPSSTKVDTNRLFDSALSREPVLHNILYKGKEEEEKEGFWSKDQCPKNVIKEPDRLIETPIGQAEITEVDKSLGSDLPKIRGASLTEMFTPDQLKVHLETLKQWVGETQPKIDEKLAMGQWKNVNACQLCGVEKLFFAVGCFLCGKVFKKMDTYHSAFKFGLECRVCNKCSKKSEGEKLSGSGLHINQDKLSLDTDRLYQETFVQCERCNGWQHHICALFNDEMNIGEKAEYSCPKCSMEEIKNGLRVPLDRSFIPGATDLPTTELSDFIEDRLFSCLKKERDARAKSMGKNSDEVLGAEDLVVRVVLSVDKKLLVKQEFLDVFKEENYPKELPYRSKFILLFQKIDGVDVCLFGMYVQEYGSKCAHPNQRSIYISYLDSVKYFRPDGVKTATGESLRTLVYQQILVGYLDYCRRRGFSRCYIWSCPPSKADSYIFNCHPEIQKSPKIGTLRDWYGEMLRKAAKENIVASVTNLYDYFFAPHGEQKVTAARLPYFDGDYWPLIAEDLLKKRIKDKPTPIRKARKQKPSFEAVECTDTSGDSPMGDQLMQDLGKEIRKKKENFIVVDLQTQHMAEEDTDQDEDKVIEGLIFDGRYNLLDFCMQHHYQFDNLQRAKHSSMMILYYLHNPSAYIQKKTGKNGVIPKIGQQEICPQGKGKGSKSRLFDRLKS